VFVAVLECESVSYNEGEIIKTKLGQILAINNMIIIITYLIKETNDRRTCEQVIKH